MVGGASRAAQSVLFLNANHIVALVDLSGLAVGSYQVVADDGGKTALPFGTFIVTSNPPGETGAFMYLKTIGPQITFVTSGGARSFASQVLAFGEFNTSDSPLPAPLYVIRADNVQPGQQTQGPLGPDTVPPSFLPGNYYNLDAKIISYKPAVGGDGVTTTYQLYVIEPTQTLMNWDQKKESLRPSTISPGAWDAIWANLRPQLGDTLADFWQLLTTDSEKLAESGDSINAIDRLFSFELEKANNMPALPVSATVVDVAFPAPGLPLVFARTLGNTITGRYQLGRLGRGWSDNFDVWLHEDATTGLVSISQAGGQTRFFARQPDASYLGSTGEFATLTRVNGVFQLRDKSGEVVAFRIDGLFDYVEDDNRNRITAGYAGNQLTSLTNTNGAALTLSYTGARLTQITDPTGGVTNYEYDPSGEHLIRVTTTEGTTEYAYTADTSGPREHALASITFLDGTHSFFDYDGEGRLIRQQGDGGAAAVRYNYDVASFTATDAQNHVTTVLYDDSFQVRRVIDPLGRVSTIDYDASNLPVIVGTSGGGESNLGYDALGNPTSAQDPLGEALAFTYEPNRSRLMNWKDALGHVTQFSHDANGNLTSRTQVDGSTDQYAYDAQGNVVGTVNRLGQNTRLTYNSTGQVTRKDLSDGTHVDYSYNARGNLETVVEASGTTRMEYLDANPDLLTKITYSTGRFLQYTYEHGRRARMVDQSGFAVNYSYDAAGRLDVLRDSVGGLIVDYDYDPVGRLARETHGNGTVTEYTYSDAGQLLKILNFAPGGAIQSQLVYAYDNLGRRTSVAAADGITTYAYDGVGRCTQATLPTGRVITYAYDAGGNRTTASDNGATTSYTTNDLNEYIRVGSTTQTFDAAGNLLSSSNAAGSTSYRYDAEGRLVSQITPAGTWTYEYDFQGNRIASVHDGVRTEYLVDPSGLGNVVGEYDGAGNLQAHYVQGLGLASRVDAAGTADFYQFDALGNTTQLTGTGGAVLNTYKYLPFGESSGASETVANPFEYVGRLGIMRDGSGLDYMRARWYEPSQGRFTQADPIGLAGGVNPYTYGTNNPISFVDPSGLVPLFNAAFPQNPVNNALVNQALTTEINPAPYMFSPLSYEVPSPGGTYAPELASDALARTTYINPPNYSQFASQVEAAAEAQVAKSAATTVAAPVAAPALEGLGVATLTAIGILSLESIAHSLWALETFVTTGNDVGCLPGLPAATQVCNPNVDFLTGKLTQTLTITQTNPAKDPNDIIGPAGFGPEGFVGPQPPLSYQIQFLNKPDALGPAEQVVVTQDLDSNLDLDTFEFSDLGFGDITVTVPTGRQFYSTRLDLRSTRGVFVDITAQLDRATRKASWTFLALDPETMDLPSDPAVGFLPPDKTTPEGEGFVSFSARAKAGLPSGTRLDAQASIVFDTNAPLATNTATNRIDAGAPSSSVGRLPTLENATFTVRWNGADDAGGSGIGTYDVYVSDNNADYTLWQKATTATSAIYTNAIAKHSYRFYVVATDNVGHAENVPATFDTQTVITDLVWQNAENRLDTDHDTFVVAADVLAIINYINANQSGLLPAIRPSSKAYVDVTGDKNVAADDVVTIINWINAHPGQSEAEATSGSIGPSGSSVDVLRAGQATTALTTSPTQPIAESTTNMSMADLVSLLAAEISSQEAKRRRL
jgi:RHS repeat-associated protein